MNPDSNEDLEKINYDKFIEIKSASFLDYPSSLYKITREYN